MGSLAAQQVNNGFNSCYTTTRTPLPRQAKRQYSVCQCTLNLGILAAVHSKWHTTFILPRISSKVPRVMHNPYSGHRRQHGTPCYLQPSPLPFLVGGHCRVQYNNRPGHHPLHLERKCNVPRAQALHRPKKRRNISRRYSRASRASVKNALKAWI